MENIDPAILNHAISKNFEIKKLYDNHVKYEQQIEDFANKRFLTDAEQIEFQRIKKQKLKGKEQLLKLISDYQTARLNQ